MATTAPERSKQKAGAKSFWNSFWVWGGPVGAILLASFFNEPLGNLGLWLGRAVVNFCHTAPFLVGATVLLVLWLLYWALGHNPNPLETVRGADKRWSTSKLQFFFWTVMVIFSYATVYAALIGAHALVKIGEHNAAGSLVSIPGNLLLAMGLSVATALAAKGITVSQLNHNATAKEFVGDNEAELSDFVKDDGGAIDLTKVQMLGWTVLALGAYFSQVVNKVVNLGYVFPSGPVILPDIDTSLMVLMGLGHAAYLTKKAIAANTPAITDVTTDPPAGARPGFNVTLKGSAFGTAQSDSVITFNGVNAGFPVSSWRDTEIICALQDKMLDWSPGKKLVGVTVNNQKSNSFPITVLRQPKIKEFSWSVDIKSFKVMGEGFGTRTNVDMLKLNDTKVDKTLWSDQVITFDNPAPSQFTPGKELQVSLYLDGDKDTPTARSEVKTLA